MMQAALFADTAETIHDDSDSWYTPPAILNAARAAFGGRIDTDPASSPAAQQVVQAGRAYYADGEHQSWYGTVWLNPPYSAPMPWVERFLAHDGAGIMLVNCVCSPVWSHRLWAECDAVCLFQSRIRFWHPTKKTSSYDRDSAAFYRGNNPAAFRQHFAQFGIILDLRKASA